MIFKLPGIRPLRAAATLVAASSVLLACAPSTPAPTPTFTAEPSPVLTATASSTVPSGPPTLPPTFTPTASLTHTPTPTETRTPTITPTPRAEDLCDALEFPAESIDGLTFGTRGASQFFVGVNANAGMGWVLLNLDTGISELLTFENGQTALVSPATLVRPGRYRWTVYITTPDYPRICETSAEFTLIDDAPPTPTQGFFSRLFDLLRPATPTPTPAQESTATRAP